MQTASLELCRELYELSGWLEGTEKFWFDPQQGKPPQLINDPFRPNGYNEVGRYPAYDLSYLLRKLPAFHGQNMLTLKWIQPKQEWLAGYEDRDGFVEREVHSYGPDPEDAACKLAIELFKQGVLTPKNKET